MALDLAADNDQTPIPPTAMLELNQVHNLDCLQGLKQLDSDSVDVCVTSPPYWGQRGDACIGIEPDPRDFVRNVVAVLAEVMRVLKPTGLLWLNLGDSYNTPINWRFEDHVHSTLGADRAGLAATNSAYTKNRGARRAFIDKESGWLQYGNLLMLPSRILMALCDQGFLYRGEVIWAKRKAMPEGRCRRPHRKHEGIYLLAKSEAHAFTVSPPVPSVWDIQIDVNKTSHTSTFPLDLPIKCIQASGVSTGVVMDPFMGSGTTGLAARLLGFDYIGFELDPTRAAVARDRISAGTPELFSDAATQQMAGTSDEGATSLPSRKPSQEFLAADLFSD